MAEIAAISLKDRNDVFRINSGDYVLHNGLRVFVIKITVAMGGDVCVEGVCHSYSGAHKYNIFYGDLVFWGSRGIAKNLMDYLNNKFYGRKP